jgi:hypothetical protein
MGHTTAVRTLQLNHVGETCACAVVTCCLQFALKGLVSSELARVLLPVQHCKAADSWANALVLCCLQSADEGLVSSELFKRHAGAEFEAWIKQGLTALGIELSPTALEMARTDTNGAANAAAAAAALATGVGATA